MQNLQSEDYSAYIPVGWNKMRLEQLCEILDYRRIPIKDSERAKRKGSIPYYGASGIIDYINDFIFNEKLLCLAEDGENLRSRMLPIAFSIEGKTWVNNHAHVLKPLERVVKHEYLKNFLNHIKYEKYLTYTAQPKLTQDKMKHILILVPPLKEQQKIASTLSIVDELIQKTDQIIEQTQRLKKGLMQKLLTKGIGHTNYKTINFGFRFLTEKIPESWKVSILRDLSISGLQNGIFKKRDEFGEGVPIVNVSDLFQDHDIKLSELERVKVSDSELINFGINEGDVFFCRSSLVVDGIGRCNLVSKLYELSVFECHVIMCRPNKQKIHPKFLTYFIQSNLGRKFLLSIAMTLTMTTIRQPDLEKMIIFIPPLVEQEKILSIIESVDSKIDMDLKYLRYLKNIKNGLMQNLLTGKIRVKV